MIEGQNLEEDFRDFSQQTEFDISNKLNPELNNLKKKLKKAKVTKDRVKEFEGLKRKLGKIIEVRKKSDRKPGIAIFEEGIKKKKSDLDYEKNLLGEPSE